MSNPTRAAAHMRSTALLLAACLAIATLTARAAGNAPTTTDDATRTALERIVRTRGFTRGVPRNAMPSPDGKRVYFLRSGPADQHQEPYFLDVATGGTQPLVDLSTLGEERTISKAEQARRERQRQTEHGVTSFQVADDGRSVLLPFSGDLYILDTTTGHARALTSTPEAEVDADLSPDGRWVAFERGNDLVVLEVATGHEQVVAHSDDPQLAYGSAEFIAQEEMDRSTGHWWSPDSRSLAFTSSDTHAVPRFRVPDFHDPTGEGNVESYPKAGDPNAVVRLYVTQIGATQFKPLDLGSDVEYIARVAWSPKNDALWVQTQPRSQKRLEVRRVDVQTGEMRIVWREEAPDWVDLHDAFHLTKDGAHFLWVSARTGHTHLEVIGAAGKRERVLTSGDWDVIGVADFDEQHGTVTFTATKDGVTERQLYRVPFKGGAVERLSREPGWHEAAFHREGHEVYAESFSDDRHAPHVRVWRRNGKTAGELPSGAQLPELADLGPEAQYLHLEGASAGVGAGARASASEGGSNGPGSSAGTEPLDVRLVLPASHTGVATVPLIVYVYAGPTAQQVQRRWPGERGLFEGWLASRGFAVARIDGRGIEGRGHASAHIYAGRLGDEEIDDQVAGVRALLARFPELDPARVGIWGWSYGGYATLMALARGAGTFRAGVSVAPVVDWRDYDTHYTERYLGLPSANTAGYDSSSVLTWAGRIRGHLTLVHGATDDNVHFRESMLLVDELVKNDKQFDLMVYPGTHMMESLAERMHLFGLIYRTFATQMAP